MLAIMRSIKARALVLPLLLPIPLGSQVFGVISGTPPTPKLMDSIPKYQHRARSSQQRTERVRQQGGFQRQHLCLAYDATAVVQQLRQWFSVYFQNLTSERGSLGLKGRKAEFTRGHLPRKVPDFKTTLVFKCISVPFRKLHALP